MSKKLTIFLIVILSIATILLTTTFIFLLKGKTIFNFNMGKYKEVVLDESFSDVNDIILDTNGADINVQSTNGNEVKVVIKGLKDKTDAKFEDGKLIINTNVKECHFLCINSRIADVTIYVPKNYDGNIDIKSKKGDIEVEDLENASLDVSLNFGDIKIDSIKDLKISSNFGDVEVKYISNYFDIEADFGDVKINEINILKDSFIDSNFGDVVIKRTNSIFIDSKASFGDNDVDDNNKKSETTLKIKASFGDIKVN